MNDEQYKEILKEAHEKYTLYPFDGLTDLDIEGVFHRAIAEAAYQLGLTDGFDEGYKNAYG
jgi:hypothetical protein